MILHLFKRILTALNPGVQNGKLSLNANKCVVIRFSLNHNPDPPLYRVSDVVLKQVNSHRDLGVIANHSLSWSEHCNTICSKAYRSLNLIIEG